MVRLCKYSLESLRGDLDYLEWGIISWFKSSLVEVHRLVSGLPYGELEI